MDKVFLIGAFGGFAAELLHWWGFREKAEFPAYAKKVFYWLVTLAMIMTGAGIAYLQLGPGGDLKLAFELGLLAPMVLKKMAAQAPIPTGAQGAAGMRLRTFLRG